MKTLALIIAVLLTVSCTQPPKPLRGDFNTDSPKSYAQNPVENLAVRWTGFVVDIENKSDHSCLTIISKLADQHGKPSRRYRMDTGRFIACKPQFIDPASTLKKPVTVTGHVKKLLVKNVDEHPYPHPLVDASVIYIW